MEIIHVNLEQNLHNNELIVNFKNISDITCFMDYKRIFKNGKYTLDCLKIYDKDGVKVKRLKYLKMLRSEFPEEYMKFEPGESYFSVLKLDEIFNIKTNVVTVQYSSSNTDPNLDDAKQIESNVIDIRF